MSEMIDLLQDNQEKLRRILQSTAADLWGSSPVPDVTGSAAPAAGAVSGANAVKEKAATAELIWNAADETVDWTSVLSHDTSPDGLTSSRLWSFYRTHAEKVLQGDLTAYVEVLKACNPLGDLTAYTSDMQIRTPGADRVEAQFTCREESCSGERNLCGLALRVARDLFALLPVTEVGIQASRDGLTVLEVTFRREGLRKQNFRFMDPVAFARENGAVIR